MTLDTGSRTNDQDFVGAAIYTFGYFDCGICARGGFPPISMDGGYAVIFIGGITLVYMSAPVQDSRLFRRASSSVGTFAFGVMVGTFASLYHAVLFPWGLTVVLVLVTFAVAGVRTLFVERYPVVWACVGIVGALMMLAGVDGNGSVLIIADTPGLVLLGGTTLLVVGAIAWPRFPPRTSRYDMAIETSERTHQP